MTQLSTYPAQKTPIAFLLTYTRVSNETESVTILGNSGSFLGHPWPRNFRACGYPQTVYSGGTTKHTAL